MAHNNNTTVRVRSVISKQWFIQMCCLAGLLLGVSFNSNAAANNKAIIYVIIDDIGYRHTDDQALVLPSEVTLSILPHTPLAEALANKAHGQSREVMLHLPMAAYSDKSLGPGAITPQMVPEEISFTFANAINSVPFAIGVNNHMGSELTASEEAMTLVMQQIKQRNLFFVDSRTTPNSVAQDVAQQQHVPNARRHVFLDHELTEHFMQSQWQRLIRLAKHNGRAIAIAHPHPESIAFLQQQLGNLDTEHIELRPISHYFRQGSSQALFTAEGAVLPATPIAPR